MRIKIVWFVIVLVIAIVYLPAQDVPLPLQVKLMLKILSMDRNFDRFGDPIKIGVSSDEFLKELDAVKGKLKIKGSDFEVQKITSPDEVANFKVIYMGKGWADNYAAASAKAPEHQCLVFCEEEAGVLKGGGAVSFVVEDGKPIIVINEENAKKQGTDFPAGFLQICKVVK